MPLSPVAAGGIRTVTRFGWARRNPRYRLDMRCERQGPRPALSEIRVVLHNMLGELHQRADAQRRRVVVSPAAISVDQRGSHADLARAGDVRKWLITDVDRV